MESTEQNEVAASATQYEYLGKKFKVPPVHLALVHLNKPIDIAHIAQIALATDHIVTHQIGSTLDFGFQKVAAKVASWNIKRSDIDSLSRRETTLDDLKEEGFRLVGTAPEATQSALDFEWQDNDVIVIGGANGLSERDMSKMDEMIGIPTSDKISFLTVTPVVSILVYDILDQRGLWASES